MKDARVVYGFSLLTDTRQVETFPQSILANQSEVEESRKRQQMENYLSSTGFKPAIVYVYNICVYDACVYDVYVYDIYVYMMYICI